MDNIGWQPTTKNTKSANRVYISWDEICMTAVDFIFLNWTFFIIGYFHAKQNLTVIQWSWTFVVALTVESERISMA